MGKHFSMLAAAARASRRLSCSLYACMMAPAGVSLPEPEGGAEAGTGARLLIKLCNVVERWLRDGAASGGWVGDCNGDEIDMSLGTVADVTARVWLGPEVDFFRRRFLGRCRDDGGGGFGDWSTRGGSAPDIVGGPIMDPGEGDCTLALLGQASPELRAERGIAWEPGSEEMETVETALSAAGLLSKRLTSRRDGWSEVDERSKVQLSER